MRCGCELSLASVTAAVNSVTLKFTRGLCSPTACDTVEAIRVSVYKYIYIIDLNLLVIHVLNTYLPELMSATDLSL